MFRSVLWFIRAGDICRSVSKGGEGDLPQVGKIMEWDEGVEWGWDEGGGGSNISINSIRKKMAQLASNNEY